MSPIATAVTDPPAQDRLPALSKPIADPLSEIVGMLRPHDCVAAGLDAGGDWAIRFARHEGVKCNAVLKGKCHLDVDGPGGGLQLRAGDCFILPHGRPFLISSDGARSGEDAETLYSPVPHGGTVVHGGGGAFFMTGSRFLVSGPAANALLAELPPAIVVRESSRSEVVRWVIERIAAELRGRRSGGGLVIAHLSHMLLIEVLRQHLARSSEQTVGWMAALADPRIAPAVAAMHADPAHPWTVEALGARAAMSRTTFAVRFRRVVGRAPMAYLAQWRMLRAADRLARTTDPIACIAVDCGYASESAFAHAFKREMGSSPRCYAHDRRVEATTLQA